MIKLFLGIFTRLKRFFGKYFTCVSVLEQWLTGRSADRTGRPHQRPVDPWGRPTCTSLCTFGSHRDGRPDGRPDQRALLSVYFGRPGGRPSWPNGHISDRWRSAGRPTASLSGCQISLTASFCFGLYKPQFFGILAKVFTREKLLFP